MNILLITYYRKGMVPFLDPISINFYVRSDATYFDFNQSNRAYREQSLC